MFGEIQKLNISATQQGTRQEHLVAVVDKLQRVILEGEAGQPSVKSQMESITRRVSALEDDVETDRKSHIEIQKAEFQIKAQTIDNRTKIIVSILGIVSLIVGAGATAYFASKFQEKKEEVPVETQKDKGPS